MPETLTEAAAALGRRGGQARAARMTPEARQAAAPQASLARAVARVLDHWPEVDPRARRRFAELLQQPEEVDGR
jgi:hypothetical protein